MSSCQNFARGEGIRILAANSEIKYEKVLEGIDWMEISVLSVDETSALRLPNKVNHNSTR
ncbi:MAG: hypothetical protein AB1500_09255 [Bacillota bacterium]